MIIGIAMKIEFINNAPNIVKRIHPNRIKRYSFPFQPKLLNLRAIRRIGELRNIENKVIKAI